MDICENQCLGSRNCRSPGRKNEGKVAGFSYTSVNGYWMKGPFALVKLRRICYTGSQIKCQNVGHFTHSPAAVLPEHGVNTLISL